MKVKLSGVLLRFVDFQKEIEVDAPTLGEALSKLTAAHPQLARVLYDADGKVRAAHALHLNGDKVPLGELGRATKADDRLEIVTLIAGG